MRHPEICSSPGQIIFIRVHRHTMWCWWWYLWRCKLNVSMVNTFKTLCCVVLSHSVVSDSAMAYLTRLLCPWRFSRQEYRSGLPCLSPRNLPKPRTETGSPAFQADSLPTEPLGKHKNTGVGSLTLLQGIFLTQELNWGLLHCR